MYEELILDISSLRPIRHQVRCKIASLVLNLKFKGKSRLEISI